MLNVVRFKNQIFPDCQIDTVTGEIYRNGERLKQRCPRNGYRIVRIDGKSLHVHCLQAMSAWGWHPNVDVHFKDQNKQNCALSNLDYTMTRSEHRKEHTVNLLSVETRKKISEANTGKKHSEESRKKQSELFKGRRFSEEWKKHISEGKKGKPLSPEHKAKLAEANRRNPPMKGRHHSTETKAKLAEANIGKTHSLETKEKLSKLIKGTYWWNNGLKNMRSRDCPGEGWVKGRLR